jgi:hypothetical protein
MKFRAGRRSLDAHPLEVSREAGIRATCSESLVAVCNVQHITGQTFVQHITGQAFVQHIVNPSHKFYCTQRSSSSLLHRLSSQELGLPWQPPGTSTRDHNPPSLLGMTESIFLRFSFFLSIVWALSLYDLRTAVHGPLVAPTPLATADSAVSHFAEDCERPARDYETLWSPATLFVDARAVRFSDRTPNWTSSPAAVDADSVEALFETDFPVEVILNLTAIA